MMNDETFFAWLDGELGAAEAAQAEAAVAANPALQRKAEAQRALRAKLGAAFDPIASAPVPDRLLATSPSADVLDFARERPHRAWAKTIPSSWQWGAMAATLALGLLAGSTLGGGDSSIATDRGHLVAAGALSQALDTRLASAPADSGPRIGLTFRDSAGRICRSFTDASSSGLACHEDRDWRIRGLFAAPEGQQAQYRMAGGQDVRLAELVGAYMAGEPLDAAGERKARDSGWR
jgi:hypothetical protein